jgi:hypothetical protein
LLKPGGIGSLKDMPKRSSKRSRSEDVNEAAFRVMREATGEKNPAAVALGRLGGIKGGPARAAKLSAKKRQQIARKAANARWKPRPQD